MSTRQDPAPAPSKLSPATLVIASLSSIAAAVFIHKFWKGGAILGAGLTPIIVAIVSEALRRPTQVITQVRTSRTSRTYDGEAQAGVAPDPGAPDAGAAEREDRFGIWEADQQQQGGLQWRKVRGKPLKVAVVTGLLAFVIAVFAVTGADLVFGGPGGGGDRFTVIPGTQKKSDDDKTKTTQTTETVTQTETVPAAPEQEAPQTVPTTPQTVPTTPPAQTTPAVPPTETAPAVPPTTTPAPATPQG